MHLFIFMYICGMYLCICISICVHIHIYAGYLCTYMNIYKHLFMLYVCSWLLSCGRLSEKCCTLIFNHLVPPFLLENLQILQTEDKLDSIRDADKVSVCSPALLMPLVAWS